jgi:hypothetical protein
MTVNSVFSSAAAAGAAAAGPASGDRGGGRHAELVFHRLDELGQLEHRHRSDLVEDFSLDSGHRGLLDS